MTPATTYLVALAVANDVEAIISGDLDLLDIAPGQLALPMIGTAFVPSPLGAASAVVDLGEPLTMPSAQTKALRAPTPDLALCFAI